MTLRFSPDLSNGLDWKMAELEIEEEFFPRDPVPGEIFLKVAKEGSALSGFCQAFCRAFSLAMQHGLSIEDAVARFKGMRFEPMGSTSNPEIPQASSIVDYIACYLELHFSEHAERRL